MKLDTGTLIKFAVAASEGDEGTVIDHACSLCSHGLIPVQTASGIRHTHPLRIYEVDKKLIPIEDRNPNL